MNFTRTKKQESDGTHILYKSGKWEIRTINGWDTNKQFDVANMEEATTVDQQYGSFPTLKGAKEYIKMYENYKG